MDNKTKTTVDSVVEKKYEGLSRKVWDMERSDEIINVNKDGSLPNSLRQKIQEGKLVLTNHIKDSKRTAYTKINGQIISFELSQLKNGNF